MILGKSKDLLFSTTFEAAVLLFSVGRGNHIFLLLRLLAVQQMTCKLVHTHHLQRKE